MHVILVGSGTMAVIVTVIIHFHGYDIDFAVAYFAHGHEFIRELAYLPGDAAKDDGLQAVVVVKVDVHR